MKIGITGPKYKLAQEIIDYISKDFEIVLLEDKIDNIEGCDVFINCLYENRLQEKNLIKAFEMWKDTSRLIINIVSSSVLDKHPWAKSFVENKRRLADTAYDLSSEYPNKKVRVTNIYPFTLSSNKAFDQYNKVENHFIAKTISWLLETPSDQEIRDITVYPSTINAQRKVDKLI